MIVVLGDGNGESVIVVTRALGVGEVLTVDTRVLGVDETVIVDPRGPLDPGDTVIVEETTTRCGPTEVVFGAVVDGSIVTGTTVVTVEDVMIGVGAGRVKITGTTAREVEDDVM